MNSPHDSQPGDATPRVPALAEANADQPSADPGFASVQRYLLYTLSLPERALRSSVGVVGGALRESTSLLVPQAFQNSQTYSVMIRQMLDYLVEDVGGVARAATAGESKIENFVARKAVGNFIEFAGLATLHVSPLTLLAVVSDVAYGSKVYLKELGEELRKEGVIDENSTIDSLDDLLGAVAQASQVTATAFDTPPLSAEGLRQTIEETRAALAQVDATKVIPQAELARVWDEMHEIARRDGVNLIQLSSAMTLHALGKISHLGRGAMSSVRVAGNLLDRHVIDHYQQALADIRARGVFASVAETSGPYIEAVWKNFSTDQATITEQVLSGQILGQAWSTVRRWLGGGS